MDERASVPDEAPRRLLDAGEAAVSWWKQRKPVGWGIAKHLANPTVNCVNYREKRLAQAAAHWYRVTHPSAGASHE